MVLSDRLTYQALLKLLHHEGKITSPAQSETFQALIGLEYGVYIIELHVSYIVMMVQHI